MRSGKVTEVIAKWAEGCRDLQYSGCNVSIRNGVLYSYNMPLAKCKGKDVYLVPYENCPSKTTKVHYREMFRHVWADNLHYVEDVINA